MVDSVRRIRVGAGRGGGGAGRLAARARGSGRHKAPARLPAISYGRHDRLAWRRGGVRPADRCGRIRDFSGAAVSAPPPPRQPPAPAQPAICVLPFANKSGDPEQDYFSEGITEDVITDLCKISALTVIGQNSSAPFTRGQVDLKQLAAGLGAGYVVEGTIRKSASQLRITAN